MMRRCHQHQQQQLQQQLQPRGAYVGGRVPFLVASFSLVVLALLLSCAPTLTSAASNTSDSGNLCAMYNYTCPSGGCPRECESSTYYCAIEANDTMSGLELECRHYDAFLGDIGRDVGTIVVLFFCLALASAGGIGGGGIIVPMLTGITQFSPFYAIPLSSTAIVGGSLVQVYFQFRRYHPDPRAAFRRLPDFETILLLLPMTLAGSVVGVLINSVSPDWFVLATVVLVLAFTTFKTTRKGFELRRKARAVEDARSNSSMTTVHSYTSDDSMASIDGVDDDGEDGNHHHHHHHQAEPSESSKRKEYELKHVGSRGHDDDDDDEGDEEDDYPGNGNGGPKKLSKGALLEKIKRREGSIPWGQIGVTIIELAGVIVLSLLRGGRGTSLADVDCGSPGYWGLQGATLAFLLIASWVGFQLVKRQHRQKVRADYLFIETDINYIERGVHKYLFASFIAGLLAGFLGIGGGMVLAPLLLQIGMHPLVSSGTTAYMTLFAAAGSFTQFVILGRVPWRYGVALFTLSLFGSATGQVALYSYVKRTGNVFVIAFILAVIIGLACVLLLITGTLSLLDAYHQGESFGFNDLCG